MPLLSACLFIFLIASSCIFTYGYLIPFNTGLIWFVSYTDLVRTGLISSLFVLVFFSVIHSVMLFWSDHLEKFNSLDLSRKLVMAISYIIVMASGTVIIYKLNVRYVGTKSDKYAFIIIFCMAFAVFSVIRRFANFSKTITPMRIYGDVVFLLTIVFIYGIGFGVYTKYTSEFIETIHLDDRVLYGAKTIFTANTVLYTDGGDVLIVPKDRVREIRASK